MSQDDKAPGRVEQARNLLLEDFNEHRATCPHGSECPHDLNLVAYICHSLGIRLNKEQLAQVRAMIRAYRQYHDHPEAAEGHSH